MSPTAKEIAKGWPEYGIHGDVPFEDYLAIDAVSNSYLGKLKQCPAKALMENEDTPALGFGRAVHSLVLEGFDPFRKDFAVMPKIDKRTKVGKARYATFLEKHGGKGIITVDEYAHAFGMRKAIHSHPMAKKLLAQGVTEQTVIWTSNGTRCKSRPDALPGGKTRALVDLKTTEDASPEGFKRSIKKWGYARQAAFYLDAMNLVKSGKVGKNRLYDVFIIIAVEKKPPYMVATFQLDQEYIEAGREEYKELIELNRTYEKDGFFPPYQSGELQLLEKPPWE
ncbi:MAG: PD-(D/E)XK nuclease-like domain-containing protein [Deltaproteobacteria bacterium]|nr:PD-(D/E)XK nuclease-like domain-containing protein [Deltaproteobacteria bacterium]